jgi:hypothetical protein
MHLTPGSQVCVGCGQPLGAEATPLAAPAIEAVAPPVLESPDNPWRTTPSAPDEQIAHPIAPVQAPVAEVEPDDEGPALPPEKAAPSQAVISADLATPASRGPLLAFDPLPPVAAAASEDPYVTASAVAPPTAPTIPVEEVDGIGTVRGHAHSTEDTLAVPAAYATFAPEPAQQVAAYQPEAGHAEVVPLDFPAVLTVAPPQAPVAGWPDIHVDPYVETQAAQAQ